MKTADEIRRRRDHLRVAMQMPCGCAGTIHEEGCVRGSCMMQAVVQTLGWVLDDDDAMQDLVDRMAKDVAEFIEEKARKT